MQIRFQFSAEKDTWLWRAFLSRVRSLHRTVVWDNNTWPVKVVFKNSSSFLMRSLLFWSLTTVISTFQQNQFIRLLFSGKNRQKNRLSGTKFLQRTFLTVPVSLSLWPLSQVDQRGGTPPGAEIHPPLEWTLHPPPFFVPLGNTFKMVMVNHPDGLILNFIYSPLLNRSNVSLIFFRKFVPLFFAY